MPHPARLRAVSLAVALLLSAVAPVMAADGAAVGAGQKPVSSIVIGFVGGFVRHTNPHHGPVQVAERLHRSGPDDMYVQVFENRHRKQAYKKIIQLLDADHDGDLSVSEKSKAHIVLFGQSWGASAVVMLARELERAGIPVQLTVQVDSVAKLWQQDGVIPDNVDAAVNFYQPHGLIHGRHEITAADPARTQILGNYRIDYRSAPVKCEGMPWLDRTLTPSHMQSECDPHLWSEVERLVRRTMTGTEDAADVASFPR